MRRVSVPQSKRSASTAKSVKEIPKLGGLTRSLWAYLALPEQRLVFGLPFSEMIPSTPRTVRLSSDESATCATRPAALVLCTKNLISRKSDSLIRQRFFMPFWIALDDGSSGPFDR